MTYFAQTGIKAVDSPSIDAFGRWRSSDPHTMFDSTNIYNNSPFFWENILNNGTVTHLPNESSVQLSTNGTTSGNYAYRQTRQYFRYQPGKSQMILITGVLGAKKNNVRQRVGYFDTNNGIFLEQTSAGLWWIVRTYTGGSPNDTSKVEQADWNIDPMDGQGPSGYTINMANSQIMFIDFEWLGVGRVRVGFVIDGKIIYVHEFNHANVINTVYMTTPHLPVRWEIENTGLAASATTMKQICVSVISEGGVNTEQGLLFTANRGTSALTVTSRRAVLSIRPTDSTNFNSITPRGLIEPLEYFLSVTTNPALVEIVYNPTFTGTPTWTPVSANNSMVEYSLHGDAAAGAFSSGTVLESNYAATTSGTIRATTTGGISSKLPIARDSNGANPIALSIACTSTSGNASILAGINWKELY